MLTDVKFLGKTRMKRNVAKRILLTSSLILLLPTTSNCTKYNIGHPRHCIAKNILNTLILFVLHKITCENNSSISCEYNSQKLTLYLLCSKCITHYLSLVFFFFFPKASLYTPTFLVLKIGIIIQKFHIIKASLYA